jgi:hypothetical protein
MLMSPKKKIATIILGNVGESEEDHPDFVQEIGEVIEEAVPVIEEDASIPLEAAAEDVIEAMKSENPQMLVEAMKAMMELLKVEE